MKKDKIKNTNGTTMVEVIVAFSILLLCLAFFTKCVTFSSAMLARASEKREQITKQKEAIYGADTKSVTDASKKEDAYEFYYQGYTGSGPCEFSVHFSYGNWEVGGESIPIYTN